LRHARFTQEPSLGHWKRGTPVGRRGSGSAPRPSRLARGYRSFADQRLRAAGATVLLVAEGANRFSSGSRRRHPPIPPGWGHQNPGPLRGPLNPRPTPTAGGSRTSRSSASHAVQCNQNLPISLKSRHKSNATSEMGAFPGFFKALLNSHGSLDLFEIVTLDAAPSVPAPVSMGQGGAGASSVPGVAARSALTGSPPPNYNPALCRGHGGHARLGEAQPMEDRRLSIDTIAGT